MADCLITLLAHYYRYKLLSLFYFTLCYLLRDYQHALAKINIRLKILMERRIVMINISLNK